MKKKIDELSWEEFEMTIGLNEILKSNGIVYIDDLLKMSVIDLNNLKGMDDLRLQELLELLVTYIN